MSQDKTIGLGILHAGSETNEESLDGIDAGLLYSQPTPKHLIDNQANQLSESGTMQPKKKSRIKELGAKIAYEFYSPEISTTDSLDTLMPQGRIYRPLIDEQKQIELANAYHTHFRFKLFGKEMIDVLYSKFIQMKDYLLENNKPDELEVLKKTYNFVETVTRIGYPDGNIGPFKYNILKTMSGSHYIAKKFDLTREDLKDTLTKLATFRPADVN